MTSRRAFRRGFLRGGAQAWISGLPMFCGFMFGRGDTGFAILATVMTVGCLPILWAIYRETSDPPASPLINRAGE
jgi:hypothetical protein